MSEISDIKGGANRLCFPQLEREVSAQQQESIFHSARRHGVRIIGACGGRGTCGSCVVRINEGEVEQLAGQATACDKNPVANDAIQPGRKWIRACQFSALSDCSVEVAPRSLAPVVRSVDDHGDGEILPLDSAVQIVDLELPEATLKDNLADTDRVLRALGDKDLRFSLAATRELPDVLRSGQNESTWSLRAWRYGDELIGFGPLTRPTLGLAIDLGTTNVAGFLIDLESGEHLANLGVENPQVLWGGDLISRLNYAIKGDEAIDELRTAIIEAINALAHDLCQSVGHSASDIAELAICGNTAMHHLLLGLPVRQLGRAPFIAALRERLDLRAQELGITVAAGGRAHLTPNIGGFVGGDHVTALLASEQEWRAVDTALVMDIGTNTEISLIHEGRFYTASAPSGPALEAGHITCGMIAAEGAIEKVRVVDGRIEVDTIGNIKPVGVCGSGVIDTVASCHRAGLISNSGRIARGVSGTVVHDGKQAIQLANEVLFSQDDIRAVQLAKAAIRTAVQLLLDIVGIAEADIERFIIAGSFGAYIDLDSGVGIGLFPDLPREHYRQVGNAAGRGIRLMLASRQARRHAQQLADVCRYVELNSHSGFQNAFLRNIGLPKNLTNNNLAEESSL